MATVSELLAAGLQHHQAGRLREAEQIYRQILTLNADHAEALHLLGVIAWQRGESEAAVEQIGRAVELNGSNATFHSNLGLALKALGRMEEAEACLRRAVELNPQHASAHSNLGYLLTEVGRSKEAIEWCRRAVELVPDLADGYNNLGTAYWNEERLDEAIASFRRALELRPNHAEVCSNLGSSLRERGDFDEAAAWCRRGVNLDPQSAANQNNLANVLRLQGKNDEAAECYHRALELRWDYPDAHHNYSMLRLLKGDFAGGWPEYEWRWRTNQFVECEFVEPRWDGEPLEQKTILLYAEQGFGDTIQFIRYAPVVKRQNPRATIVVECHERLVNLLRSCKGIDRLVGAGEGLPAFDVHAPLLSLPGILKTTIETIPADVPYLFADSALIEEWRGKLDAIKGFRIGINWQGRAGKFEARRRDIPLEMFRGLSQIPGVRLVNLQQEADRTELAKAGFSIFDPGAEVDRARGAFMDTAAIMMNLDLMITSDTSVPHLAGALGVPVWVALHFAADWRWLLDRSDSPWYPTMRLFRQKKAGDWKGVLDEMSALFKNLLAAQ